MTYEITKATSRLRWQNCLRTAPNVMNVRTKSAKSQRKIALPIKVALLMLYSYSNNILNVPFASEVSYVYKILTQ